MDTNLFQYAYPKEQVAQHPLPQRDAGRMMILKRFEKSWEHQLIRNLPEYLEEGDLMVLNDTKVFPARLLGVDGEKRALEILLLGITDQTAIWKCLGKPLKRIKEGTEIHFAKDFKGTIIGKQNGFLEIQLHGENIEQKIKAVGLPPLPPYIRRTSAKDYSEDKERYQSIFAKHPGSAAAPTASLHFTKELLQKITDRGAEMASITLHVSSDTFLPLRTQEVTQHPMHGEYFSIPKETAEKIKRAKKEKRRVIAVGTTVVRALESDWEKPLTQLYIYPGFRFKMIDALLTNFHQPQSTLLLLVSAFAGREFILSAYSEAISKQYRLFSYGDCMLIL